MPFYHYTSSSQKYSSQDQKKIHDRGKEKFWDINQRNTALYISFLIQNHLN